MRRLSLMGLVAASGLLMSVSAHATVIFSTGVGAPGTLDTHWLITTSTGTAPVGDPTIQLYSPGTFPFTAWSAPIAGSQWITPTANAAQTFDPAVPGFYTYTESFMGTAGSVIHGQYLSDNTVTDITLLSPLQVLVGGGSFTNPPNSFAFAPLPFNGLYTLNFTVENFAQNGGNPSGLDVSVTATPEASTWAMMLLGFLGLGFVGYRRSSRSSSPTFRFA
jgi:hypothetical protein